MTARKVAATPLIEGRVLKRSHSCVPVCARCCAGDPLYQPSGCDWHMLLQICELQNQQPDQGKKPDGAPSTVPREVGRSRSCVEGSSTEVGPGCPASTCRSSR
jgi:hypothetical protein